MDINVIGSSAQVGYLGVVTQSYHPDKFEGVVFVKAGTRLTSAQAVAIKTTMSNLLKHDSAASRAYVLKNFEAMESKNTEATYNTEAYGNMYKSKNGKYGFGFKYKKGGLALHANLSTFDEQQDNYDVIFIDKKNNCLFGTKKSVAGVPYFAGFTMSTLAVQNVSINDGNNDTAYSVQINLQDEDELNLYPAVIKYEKTDRIMDNLVGNIGLELTVQTAMVAGLVKFKLTVGNGAIDMATDYSALFVTSLWSAVNATGGVITVTSATFTAATQTWDVQLNAADTDYSTLASGAPITISIGNNSALVAAGIVGFGDTSIIVNKP
jgi:hypothetical protein